MPILRSLTASLECAVGGEVLVESGLLGFFGTSTMATAVYSGRDVGGQSGPRRVLRASLRVSVAPTRRGASRWVTSKVLRPSWSVTKA